LARPKKEEASGAGDSKIAAMRKELRQINRQKAKAIDEEDFKRAKELQQRQKELSAQLKTTELQAKDQAASRLANAKDEIRHLEGLIREASEQGQLDLAVEIRQRRDKLRAEMRRMEWMQ